MKNMCEVCNEKVFAELLTIPYFHLWKLKVCEACYHQPPWKINDSLYRDSVQGQLFAFKNLARMAEQKKDKAKDDNERRFWESIASYVHEVHTLEDLCKILHTFEHIVPNRAQYYKQLRNIIELNHIEYLSQEYWQIIENAGQDISKQNSSLGRDVFA